MPTTLCHETGSRKTAKPASAINAAPPARIMGTADSGPPFWNNRKNNTVPAPTQMPVKTEYTTPGTLTGWFRLPPK